MKQKRIRIVYLAVYTCVGYLLLFSNLRHVRISQWPEMVVLSLFLFFALSCELPLRYGRVSIAVTNTFFVLGALMLGDQVIYPCFITFLRWDSLDRLNPLRKADWTSSLIFLWDSVRMVPVLEAAHYAYVLAGGGGFSSFSEIPWWPVVVLIAAIFFLDWASANVYVALSEGKPVWNAAVPLSMMFDAPLAPLAVPLYLAYRAEGVMSLILFSIPLAGGIWLSRYLLLESMKKEESQELLEVANALIRSNLNLPQTLEWIVAEVAELLHADVVEIYLREGKDLRLRYSLGESPWKNESCPPAFLRELLVRIAGVPTLLPDPREHEWLARYAQAGLFSILMVPLIADGKALGCVLCLKENERYFFQRQLESSGILVSEMSDALVTGQLHEALRAAHAELNVAHFQLQDALEQLRATQDELIRSQKMAGLGKLAAGVAHEINNPLLSILLNGEALMESVADRESVELIVASARRCKSIVEQLLFFSHQVKSRDSIIDVRGAVETSLREMKRAGTLNGIDVSIEITGEPRVMGEFSGLMQVLSSVIANAADAVRISGQAGRIAIETMGENGKCVLRISDNGCGITAENLSRIFDPFFTTKDVGKGTGLGLWVSYGIVSGMGGKIDVESTPARGTTVTLEFPMVEAACYAGEAPDPGEPWLDEGRAPAAGLDVAPVISR